MRSEWVEGFEGGRGGFGHMGKISVQRWCKLDGE